MTTYEFLKIVPWPWKLWTILITIILLSIILPYVILSICNPFWFRKEMMLSCNKLMTHTANIRFKLLRPAIEKYSLFDTLKNIQDS